MGRLLCDFMSNSLWKLRRNVLQIAEQQSNSLFAFQTITTFGVSSKASDPFIPECGFTGNWQFQ